MTDPAGWEHPEPVEPETAQTSSPAPDAAPGTELLSDAADSLATTAAESGGSPAGLVLDAADPEPPTPTSFEVDAARVATDSPTSDSPLAGSPVTGSPVASAPPPGGSWLDLPPMPDIPGIPSAPAAPAAPAGQTATPPDQGPYQPPDPSPQYSPPPFQGGYGQHSASQAYGHGAAGHQPGPAPAQPNPPNAGAGSAPYPPSGQQAPYPPSGQQAPYQPGAGSQAPYGAPQGYGMQPYQYGRDTAMASMAHWLGIPTSFLAPLIIMLTRGQQDPLVRANAVEALNFQLTLVVGWVASTVLLAAFFLGSIGYIVLPILGLIFPIMGAIAANRGEAYRYPFRIQFVK